MKKLSSSTTYFRKKVLPIILCMNLLVIILILSFTETSFNSLSILIFPTAIFFFAWLIHFRKLKEVYSGDKFLRIENEKISFRDITLVEKKSWFLYRVEYNLNGKAKSFWFLSKFTKPFLTKRIIKEIQNRN